jgi:PhnB protein
MQLNPYLLFNGDCEAAFKLYETVLGGKIEALIPNEGAPGTEQLPAEWKTKIMHGRMTVNGQVIMASDAPPGRYSKPGGFSVNISVTDPKEADRIFNALSDGGTVHMPIAETFWAVRFGMFTDRFGIPWMVNCEKTAEKAA